MLGVRIDKMWNSRVEERQTEFIKCMEFKDAGAKTWIIQSTCAIFQGGAKAIASTRAEQKNRKEMING